MNALLLFVPLLIILAIFFAFIGLYRWLNRYNEVEDRLSMAFGKDEFEISRRNALKAGVNRQIGGWSMAANLERRLAMADLKVTGAEFLMIRIGATVLCLILGWLISGWLIGGIGLAGIGWLIPGLYLSMSITKRSRAFSNQLPDMLNLLVGSLRAGYGLLHACNVVKDEMPDPISTEFIRLIREVSLGVPLNTALDHMAERMSDEDLALIITSVQVQNEVGGSLADILGTIAVTIRERIKLKGQIRVMTTQQRYTGWVLTGMPFGTGVLFMLINPEYMMEMFQPTWVLAIPATATVLVIIGNIVMQWIVKIDI